MKILGVDCNQDQRQSFVESAKRDGHEAVVADSGTQAWGLIQASQHVDLIVSAYLTLPMNGLELLRNVRGNPATATTAFVMYTGWNNRDLQAEVAALGGFFELKGVGRSYEHIFADYLPKS